MLLFLGSDRIEECDIPKRTKMRELISERYKVDWGAVVAELQVRWSFDHKSSLLLILHGQKSESRISFTSDLWSDKKMTSFMAITAHFTARSDKNNLFPKTHLLAFRAVHGEHSGENLAREFIAVLEECGLLNKVRVSCIHLVH